MNKIFCCDWPHLAHSGLPAGSRRKIVFNYMRNSVARRGAIVWNTLVPQLSDDIDNVKKYAIMARRSKTLLHLDFDCTSPQTLTRWEEDFKYN